MADATLERHDRILNGVRPPLAASRRVLAHVELQHSFDAESWRRRHAEGAVPNALPYGLNRLEEHGFAVDVRPANDSFLLQRLVGGVARRATGGMEVVDALRDRRRRQSDLVVCWDERSGIPAALRSAIPGEPPVVTGTIWLDPRELGRVGGALADRGLRRTAAVWANSERQLDDLARRGIPGDRLHLLHPPGIDADFWRSETDEPEASLVIGVGNDRDRDHVFLLDAIERLQRRRRDLRFELVTQQPLVVPPELGVRHPLLTHPELRSLYGRAAVVCVALRPNTHVSGSTVILEAMACERPVVVTGMPGVDRYVRHGESGLIVPPGDPEAFATAVGELLADPDRARAYGQAGRREIETRLSSRHLMARLAGILHGVRA
jgi:glycosyltransferase involved in cell wall biosynthesis